HGLAKLIRCIVGAIPCGRPLWAAHLISIRTVIGQQSLSLVGFLKRALFVSLVSFVSHVAYKHGQRLFMLPWAGTRLIHVLRNEECGRPQGSPSLLIAHYFPIYPFPIYRDRYVIFPGQRARLARLALFRWHDSRLSQPHLKRL